MMNFRQQILSGGVALLGYCLLASETPANEEYNQRMVEQKREVTDLLARIEQAIAEEKTGEAEALLVVCRNFIRPEVGVSAEVKLVELRLKQASLRATLAIRSAVNLTAAKRFEEALAEIKNVQGGLLTSGAPASGETLQLIDSAKAKVLQSVADDFTDRLYQLLAGGKAEEAEVLYENNFPKVAGNSIIPFLGERYSALRPLITEASAKNLKERKVKFSLGVEFLISRMKAATEQESEPEQWTDLVTEGGKMLEKSGLKYSADEAVKGRLNQAVETMKVLLDIKNTLSQGEVALAMRSAAALIPSLHEAAIVQPRWLEQFLFSRVPGALTPDGLKMALAQNPDFGELLKRWEKSSSLYQNSWPFVKGGYLRVSTDLEFCHNMQSMLRSDGVDGLGALVALWPGREGGEFSDVTEHGRALTAKGFLALCRRECGFDLQRGEGEDMRSLAKRALLQCAEQGKFRELARFMPETLKFFGHDYSSVDPFSEAFLITSYLAAGRLEAAGDKVEAARLYRSIVQRGTALYVPIDKAQERLSALFPALLAAEEAGTMKEQIGTMAQRLEQLEKEVAALRKQP